ncbi:hypothetical protein SprV_0301334300 [Sparganum proliferum]
MSQPGALHPLQPLLQVQSIPGECDFVSGRSAILACSMQLESPFEKALDSHIVYIEPAAFSPTCELTNLDSSGRGGILQLVAFDLDITASEHTPVLLIRSGLLSVRQIITVLNCLGDPSFPEPAPAVVLAAWLPTHPPSDPSWCCCWLKSWSTVVWNGRRVGRQGTGSAAPSTCCASLHRACFTLL